MIELDGKVILPSFKERFKMRLNRLAAIVYKATKQKTTPKQPTLSIDIGVEGLDGFRAFIKGMQIAIIKEQIRRRMAEFS